MIVPCPTWLPGCLQECNLAGKPVYVTRVVDTMTDAPRPTRAEATGERCRPEATLTHCCSGQHLELAACLQAVCAACLKCRCQWRHELQRVVPCHPAEVTFARCCIICISSTQTCVSMAIFLQMWPTWCLMALMASCWGVRRSGASLLLQQQRQCLPFASRYVDGPAV